MKLHNLILLFAVLITGASDAQDKALSPEQTLTANIRGVKIEVIYCRPSARGRKMVGGVDPYGKVWRTGANKATTFSVDKDVIVEGKKLPKGKYGLFTIPREKEWTIIFNKVWDQWGAYDYDPAQDVLRVVVKSKVAQSFTETFTIKPSKGDVSLVWENFIVTFGIKPA